MLLEDVNLDSKRYPLEVLADLLEVWFESKAGPEESEALFEWMLNWPNSKDVLELLRGTLK